ncbi:MULTISPECIES: BppU family phage baseplate upper protein [unclassified Lactobacillus]|uniref:BppU family phage baseplate upper protein n=3 Tax=Lactobacillus TaxID=1578 RepID=UPI00226A2F05|nr:MULTISPECIES: BppU family phage baseplate upper protein [unclassified Lactobacillus]MCX8731958.1 BppU family phage baseplate upper protein [Lactobacillus sp. B4015]MCX8734355.1 BppU family phage baseplate upper protein [Lactobacillus sp. B4012]
MSIPILTLATDKNSTTVDADRITIRQSEAGLVINANIIDADNNAYNLTNCKVFFGENKDGGKMVDDEDVEIVDRIGGQIKYKLNTAVYQESGDAWFEITDNTNKLIDTTTNFHIDVIKQANLPVENENYWSRAENMLIHVQAFVQKVENDFNSNIANNDSQLNDLVKKFNQQLENYEKELADYDSKYQKLSNDWADELGKIKANANDQLSSLKSDYDAQKKAIQSAADNQLSANKTASDKAIAQIETDKQAAIKQANTDFQNKLASIQSNYNTWKANAIDDFQSQINKLASELKNDEDAQAKLQQAIDSANKAIANINNVDFTKFAHLSDLENYYDKETMDQKLAQAGKLKQISVNGGDPINPDADGVAKLNIPQPDLSDLETKTDAKTAHDTLTADIAKRVLSINDVMADKDGKVVLPDFNHPTKIFKDAKVDPNTLTTTGIYELKNSDMQISLDSLPGFTQTNATYGYILVVNNAALDNTFQVIICRQMQDFVLDYRYINKTYNDYPKFNRLINTQDLSNVQNQMIEMKQSMMRSWTGTLTQYQALTNYDPMTIYFILSDYEVVVK